MEKIKPLNEITEQEFENLIDELKGHRFEKMFTATYNDYNSYFKMRNDNYKNLNRYFAFLYSRHPSIRLRYDPFSKLEPEIYNRVLDAYKELFGDKADYQEFN